MPAERRTEAEIRREIVGEREQLSVAIADLRQDAAAKRRPASLAAVAAAALIATLAVTKALRR